jgi:hypothetical protein
LAHERLWIYKDGRKQHMRVAQRLDTFIYRGITTRYNDVCPYYYD